jgi:hypothetical protein
VVDYGRALAMMVLFPDEGVMLTSIISPRMILFPFTFGLWLLAWSLRFLPRHRLNDAQRGIVQVTLVAIILVHLIVELSLYKSLTGEDKLEDDSFFFTTMIIEYGVCAGLAINSDSVLKRMEQERRVDH